MIRSTSEVRRALGWLLGGATQNNWTPILAMLPYLLIGLGILLFSGHALNLLQFGDDQAQQLGLNVTRTKRILLIASSLTTANSGKDNWKQYSFDKKFHVSPFMGMDMHYDWRFREPGSELNIHINSYHNGEKYFDATLTPKRQEISSRSLKGMLIEYPFITLKVIAMIYWQALSLLVKRVPFYPHPPKQRGRSDT